MTITQTAHAEATVEMSEKVWSFMWIEDRDQTVLAYLAYAAPTEAGSGAAEATTHTLTRHWHGLIGPLPPIAFVLSCDSTTAPRGTATTWILGRAR